MLVDKWRVFRAADGAEGAAVSQPAGETPDAAQDAPEGQQAADQTAASAETQAEQPDAEAARRAKAEKNKDRRFARLTAITAEAQMRAEEAERRAQAAEALLAAGKAPEGATQPPTARQPGEDVNAAAERILAQRQFEQARTSLIEAGTKEIGEDAWNEKTAILHDMGATQNPAFMAALVELPGAHKIVAELADDLDQLESLLKLSPAAMAAKLGRMSALAEIPKQAAISKAPKPVTPVGGTARAEPDPDKMTMAEYVAFRNKTAPRHLGGVGKR